MRYNADDSRLSPKDFLPLLLSMSIAGGAMLAGVYQEIHSAKELQPKPVEYSVLESKIEYYK